MRFLLSYAILYSIAHRFGENVIDFNTCGCAEFGPYCAESS